ncbi:MAG: ABC transporter substrate-binding protein [Selenomonadaceae bacterium]|nr:ABC transporter substrate-binding protein [Selenomonadaceae bacterium]
MLCMLLAVGCGQHATDKQSHGKLTVGIMPDVDSLPLVVALDKGYFAEEGLEADIQLYKSAMERDSALQSGNLDGAVSDLLAVTFAKSGGFDVKATSFTDGSYRLVAGKAAGSDLASLKGQDVAVSRNTIIEFVTDAVLAKADLKEDFINKVIIPQIPTRLEMLQNGKLAAATLPEPMASIAIYSGGHYVTGSDNIGLNPGVIIFTGQALKEKNDSIGAFYRAYNRAVKYLNQAPKEEYMDLAVEKCGFPPLAKEAMEPLVYHEATPPKEDDVAACVKWLNDKGLVTATYAYGDLVADLPNK